MRFTLDNESYRTGYEDGRAGRISKTQDELMRTKRDEWSYVSGFIEGQAASQSPHFKPEN